MTKTFGLTFGRKFIVNIEKPEPDEIDLDEIPRRLASIRRFSGNPDSLTVAQHVRLCLILGRRMGASDAVLSYLAHHDDHEAIIGDIPGPIKTLVDMHTDVLRRIETGLDLAIWRAHGGNYVMPWSMQEVHGRPIFEQAHHIDKTAETLEWQFVMWMPAMAWNKPLEGWMRVDAATMIAEACRVP